MMAIVVFTCIACGAPIYVDDLCLVHQLHCSRCRATSTVEIELNDGKKALPDDKEEEIDVLDVIPAREENADG